jgi:hypothetical protein
VSICFFEINLGRGVNFGIVFESGDPFRAIRKICAVVRRRDVIEDWLQQLPVDSVGFFSLNYPPVNAHSLDRQYCHAAAVFLKR